MKELRITIYNSYNTDQRITSTANVIVKNSSDPSITYDVTHSSLRFTCSVPDDVTSVDIDASCPGYESVTVSQALTSSSTEKQINLIPVYTIRYAWKYTSGRAPVSVNTGYTATLYEKQNGEWVQTGTCTSRNAFGYCWFNDTSHVAGAERKIVSETNGYFTRTTYISDTQTSNELTITWKTGYTAVVADVTDDQSGEVITPDTLVYTFRQKSGDTWPDTWSANDNNETTQELLLDYYGKPAYLSNHSSADIQVKTVAEKQNYESFEDIQTIGKTDITDDIHIDAAMTPLAIISFTISASDAQTSSALSNFTAVLSLNGVDLETSTNGNFSTVLDGTSTYTMTVSEAGYKTVTQTGTDFDGVNFAMTPYYTVSFTGSVKNQYTNSALPTWNYEVYSKGTGGVKEYATDLGNKVFQVEYGKTYYYVPVASGYTAVGEQTIGQITQNVTISTNVQMVPDSDAILRARTYTDATTYAPISDRTSYLYKKVSGEWSLIETHTYATSASTNYWIDEGTFEASSEYKFEIVSETSFPITIEFTTDENAEPPAGVFGTNVWYYTHTKTTWLFKASGVDAITADPIQITHRGYFEAVLTAGEFSGTWTEITYNSDLEGYVVAGESGYKYKAKIDAAASGYYGGTDTFVLGTIDDSITPMETYTDIVELLPVEQYASLTVNVFDKTHETAIEATVTVECDQTHDVITPTQGVYQVIKNYGYTYTVTASATDYISQSTTITPTASDTTITQTFKLQKIYKYCDLYVTVTDTNGDTIDDATVAVYNDETPVPLTDDHFELIYNDDITYTVIGIADGYYTETDTVTPTTADDIHKTLVLEKIPVYAKLFVTVMDDYTHEAVTDALIAVLDTTTGDYVTPAGQYWNLLAEEDHEYIVEIEADGYYDYESDPFTVDTNDPIYMTCEMEEEPLYKPLQIDVIDAETGDPLTANVVVRNETKSENVPVSHDGKYYLEVNVYQDQYYKIYVTKKGYKTYNSETFPALDTTPLYKLVSLEVTLEPFATFDDLKNRTGVDYNYEDKERIEYLLDDVSNLIRHEGRKCGVDVDERVRTDRIYASVVKTVTCDVTQRVFRQSLTGDAMSQESQSALGYSWSGTFAVPGGGTAMSLMRNEMNILGFNPQTIGVIELC